MDYARIGKITGVQGLQGKLVVRHILPDFKGGRKLDHIFIALKRESFIPYFPETWQNIQPEEAVLKLDEVNSPEEAKALVGKEVFIESTVFAQLVPGRVTTDFTGFAIQDRQLGRLGVVEALVESPGQVIASIQYKGTEVLLPLVEQTILKVDAASRTIFVNLPEGLLEVYTDPSSGPKTG